MPKTLKVELSEDDENQIFDHLIGKEGFDLRKSDIFGKGQNIKFKITKKVKVGAKLELYNEGHIEPETNADIITHQSVNKFEIWFMIDGEEIEVVRENACGKCLEDRINEKYRIN